MPEPAAGECPVSSVQYPTVEALRCPYPLYQELRAEQPIFQVEGRDEFYVSRWEDLTAIARNTRIFSNALFRSQDPTLDRILWRAPGEHHPDVERRLTPYPSGASDPPDHTVKRRLVMTFLTRERLASYEGLIQRHVDDLVDTWIDRGACEFRSEFADPLPIRVITDLLGLPAADIPLFVHWSDIESGGTARYVTEERLAADQAKTQAASAYMRDALVSRYDRPREDFLSDLVRRQVEADGELDIDYLTAEANLLLFAGNVTTAHMLANTMQLLCANPAVLDRVRADPALLPLVVDESLRVESPVQWTQRICLEDTEVGGVAIPAGSWVVMMWASGNRDVARFADPDAYSVDRANLVKHQLAFGHGIHRCAGAPLAQLEGRLAFRTLLDRMRDIRVVADADDLLNIDSLKFRVPTRLPLEFRPNLVATAGSTPGEK